MNSLAMESRRKDAQKAGERVGMKSDSIVINGGKPLTGTIEVRGAKNLATKAMVAALLGETSSLLKDVPDISDVQVVRGLLEVYGVKVTSPAGGSMHTLALAASRSSSAVRFCIGSATPASPTSAAAGSVTARSTSTSTHCASSAPSSTRPTRAST